LLSGTAAVALVVAYPQMASAQMYSTGPGFYLSAEGRYMWNAGDKVGSYSPISTPIEVSTSGPKARADKGWGGKAMLGYRFNNNWDVGIGGSAGWLKGKDSGNGFISTDGPVTGVNTSSNIKVKLRYQVADFEAGYNWTMGRNSTLRLFGGVRYAHFNQTANASLNGTDTVTGFSHVEGKRKSTYWGVGPRLGLNGAVGIGQSGFNVFGSVSGAMLYGKYKDQHSVLATGLASPTGTSIKDKNKNKWVPNAEGEIGVGYNFNTNGATTVGLQLGYRAEKWWGVSSDADVLSPTQASHSSDQLMHGPFVRLVATFGSAPPAPMASPPPPAPPLAMAKKSFIVFFDFDKSNITAEGQKTINDAVAAAKSGGSTQVTLTGHTDRSGSEQYNMALSLRRAEAVKANMIRQGIPASAIVVIGKGESQPLVPTADGVREPQYRRVEIVI
jgi:outer membrane protein OmpA-like peptidoglycan-associated protein